MRVTLIGAGRIGANHARILDSMPRVTSMRIADVARNRAEHLATELGATTVDVDRAFDDTDAVVIASSTYTHAALLTKAAHAGVAAFCEKPIALDLESTRAAVDAVERAGIPVQMGFQRRFDPAMAAIKQSIEDGGLGTPYLIRSQTHDPEPPPLDYIPVSGGIFKDCLIHDIDIVRHIAGQEVVTVTAAGAVVGFPEIGAHDDFDTATAVFEMSGGTLAQLSALRHDPMGYDVRLEVFGSKASRAAGWSDRTPIASSEPGVAPPTDPIVSFWDRFDAAYRAELEAFVDLVEGDPSHAASRAASHKDAYEDLRVAAACDLSAAERRTVSMEEIS